MGYEYLKGYAKFLLDTHLNEVVSLNIERAKEVQLPLLALFKSLSEEELFAFSRQGIQKFLLDICEETAFKSHQESLERWKSNQIPLVPKDKIDARDVAFTPHVRKYALIKMLKHYTQDISLYEAVVQDIETLYTNFLHYSFEAFIGVQQEIIEKERDLYQTILDHTDDGISAYDQEYRLIIWNKALEERTKLSREKILGKNVFEYFPGYRSSVEGQAVERVLKGEKIKLSDMPLQQRKGFYEADLIPLTNHGKQIFGGLTVSRDITQRKLASEKIIKSESRLREAQALAHIGNWEMEISSGEITFSDELYRILGFLPGIDLSLDLIRLRIHPEDLPQLHELTRKAIELGEGFTNEHRFCLPNGQIRNVRAICEVERDIQGKIVRLKGVTQDITDQKLAQMALHQKNEELLQTLEELHVTQQSLLKLNNELELRVQERTKELSANEEELRQTLEQSVSLNAKLAERENFLSSILKQTPVSTWIADANGTMIQVNEACLKLFGVEDAHTGLHTYNILQDDTLIHQPFYKDIQAVFKEGKIAKFESDYDVRNVKLINTAIGKQVSLIVTVFPIKDDQGSVISAVIQHEDITERKKAEEALKKSEEQLRLITDALPVLISFVDAKERFQFANKAYELWFDLPRTSIIGKSLGEILGEKAYVVVKPFVDRCLSGEQVYFENELDYQSGGKRFIAANLIPQYNGMEVTGYYALITDISERKRAQRALEDALQETNIKNEELKRINIDLDNFVYTASHDLKSPIANLEGITGVLLKKISKKLEKDEIELIGLIHEMTTKLKATIRDLTEITKVQKDFEEVPEKVSFEEVFTYIKADLSPLISEYTASIITNFEVKEINFARKNLRSILFNLVNNALKYHSLERKPVIHIHTKIEGEYLMLSVADNGLGIALSQIHKLFSMFKRLHTHVEGSGIGLYITKRIVENNGGRIEVESEEGKGSVFKVYFKI